MVGVGGQDKDKSVHRNKQMMHEGNTFGTKSVSFMRHLFVCIYTYVGLCPSTPGANE
jgi:hypothetical protein